MSTENTDLATQEQKTGLAVPASGSLADQMPDWLREDTSTTGTDEMLAFVRPPFVKIVQKTSAQELKDEYGEGAVLLVPGNRPILTPDQMEAGGSLLVTPLLFFAEYCTFNPIEWKDKEPLIAARSFDKNSIIAKKAAVADTRNELVLDAEGKPVLVKGKQIYYSHQECLNFLMHIHNPEAKEYCDFANFTFRGGENGTGSRLAMLISARKRAIFVGQYELRVSLHKDPYEGHCGFDCSNPTTPGVSPWILDKAMRDMFSDTHDFLVKALTEKRLDTQYGTTDTSNGEGENGGEGVESDVQADGTVAETAKY